MVTHDINIHEYLSYRLSLIEFWKTLEGDYCQVFVIDQFNDHYSVEIKYDYLSMIRKRRARSFVEKNFSSC